MTKICKLVATRPTGTILLQAGLQKQKIYKQLSQKYVESGWLIKLGKGAYVLAGEKPSWQGGVYALQKDLELKVHIGGLSAIELMGRSHYVPFDKKNNTLYIYAHARQVPRYLPKWFTSLENLNLLYVTNVLFNKPFWLMNFDFGNFTLQISDPERALFEILALVPNKISFEHAALIMQHQHNLRGDVVQQLLQECKSQVVKRLFLYLARTFNLIFMQKVNLKKINLGHGSRQIGPKEIANVYDKDLALYIPKISAKIDPNQEVPDV